MAEITSLIATAAFACFDDKKPCVEKALPDDSAWESWELWFGCFFILDHGEPLSEQDGRDLQDGQDKSTLVFFHPDYPVDLDDHGSDVFYSDRIDSI